MEREDRLETLLDDLDELEKLLPRLCLELKKGETHKIINQSFSYKFNNFIRVKLR